jgi:glycosyltransferase involved in cell wall biosynthesis
MRVLHVLPHRGGGAETYIDLLEELPDVEHDRAALSPSRALGDALRSLPGRFPGLLRAARRADVVHVHGDAAAVLALPLLAAGPAVMTTHGLHLLRRAAGPGHAALRAGLVASTAATAAVVCCSESERGDLAAILPRRLRDRLAVVHNGIALPVLEPEARRAARAALDLADGDVAALFLGELEPRKDPLAAVRAASAAAAAGAPLVLLVAGSGPLEAEVRAAAGPAVRVLGYRDDPGALLAAADVSVMPSLREGLSFAILEAMGHGHAMVVSDGPGNPEAVGDAGVVVPAGDVAALTRALAELAADGGRRADLGRRARERVARAFTADALRAGVRAAYERAAAPQGA